MRKKSFGNSSLKFHTLNHYVGYSGRVFGRGWAGGKFQHKKVFSRDLAISMCKYST